MTDKQGDSEGFFPCPFCGSKDIFVDTWNKGKKEWYGKVSDNGCGMTFMYLNVSGESKQEVIDFLKRRWNMRVEA